MDQRPKLEKLAEETLERLVEETVAAVQRMRPAERQAMWEAQQRSWVVGELMLTNPDISREEAERRYKAALRKPDRIQHQLAAAHEIIREWADWWNLSPVDGQDVGTYLSGEQEGERLDDLIKRTQRFAARSPSTLEEEESDVAKNKPDLRSLLYAILDAEQHFRNALPEEWDGDPIHDACERARIALEQGA